MKLVPRKFAVSLVIVFAVLAVAALGVAAAVTSAPNSPGFLVANNCIEHQGFFEGSDSAVAARLPRGYTAERDPAGKPLLFARAEQCDVTLRGSTARVTMASFGIVIQSPDGRGCSSGVPVVGPSVGEIPPVCNWYVLFWLANDRRIVDWLEAGTPGFPAVYVPNLAFSVGRFDPTIGGARFHFQAPSPSPSPFSLDDVGRERPGQLSVRGGYWVSNPPDTIKLAFSTDSLISGDAVGTVHAAPGSEMEKLLGSDQASYLPGYSGIAAERWGYGSYRKQVLGPSPSDQVADDFAGSCSVRGTVYFNPPATNTMTALTYRYAASGTCNGSIDGRNISNAPVTLNDSGSSMGSCFQAATTIPGQGQIVFTNRSTIGFTVDFTSILTQISLTLYGEHSGTADAEGTFLTQRTSPDLLLQCDGSGAAAVPMDLNLSTERALESLRPTTGAVGDRPGVVRRTRRDRVGLRTRVGL